MLEVFSIDHDERLRAYCINCRCTYETFLELTEGAELNLAIQRNIISGSKTYRTLRADLKRGCILPPIVLAIEKKLITKRLASGYLDASKLQEIKENLEGMLSRTELYIIDGLQRTNAIRTVNDELVENPDELDKFLKQNIRLEIWSDISFAAIAYRMLLLNAGQKPMSIKHQVEILSLKLRDDLADIDGIDIFTSKEKRRRRQPGQFHLSGLAQCFQAWIQKQPTIDMTNSVMEELLAETAIDTLGANLGAGEGADGFRNLVSWIVEADFAIGAEYLSFFGNETVMLGICAAVGEFASDEGELEVVQSSLQKLLKDIKKEGSRALGIEMFERLRKGIDTKKFNVGAATRDMVFKAFQAYFYANGRKSMERCWQLASK